MRKLTKPSIFLLSITIILVAFLLTRGLKIDVGNKSLSYIEHYVDIKFPQGTNVVRDSVILLSPIEYFKLTIPTDNKDLFEKEFINTKYHRHPILYDPDIERWGNIDSSKVDCVYEYVELEKGTLGVILRSHFVIMTSKTDTTTIYLYINKGK